MKVKYTKKKKIKDEVLQIIRNDIPLRNEIADALNVEPNSVYIYAVRKSKIFSLPSVLKIISEHTGKSEKEIIDEEL